MGRGLGEPQRERLWVGGHPGWEEGLVGLGAWQAAPASQCDAWASALSADDPPQSLSSALSSVRVRISLCQIQSQSPHPPPTLRLP